MRVLLLSPVFHGYWRAFGAALAACGHEVTTHCYDGWDRGARVRNAAAHHLPFPVATARAARLATDAAITALRRSRPDAVLVIKGDALLPAWWDALAGSGARTALWLYDELRRMTYSPATLAVPDALFSYSPHDAAALRAQGLPTRELPDGFDSLAQYRPHPSDAVTLIGARYSAREQALRALHQRGIPVAAYGREWSRHPWDILRTSRWRSAGFETHRDVPRSTYYGIMAGSVATLNIHGAGHDGFSMRTFEAPGVRALELIDRPDVARHYEVGREVLAYSSDDELLSHVEHARRDRSWAQRIRDAGHQRTIAEHTLVHRMKEVQRTWL